MKKNKFNQFKFCPMCAGKLVVKKMDHTQRQVCQKCGFIFYQNSKPTSSAIFSDSKNRILLAKRKINPKKGLWDLPGGFLEEGEDPIKGLKREMKEELGINIQVGPLIGIYLDDYLGSWKSKTLNIAYKVESFEGKMTPADDITEIKWFSKTKIPWKKLAFPWIKSVLKDWLK